MKNADRPTTLFECVVGSRLHKTAGLDSDTDVRRIVVSPLRDVINPIATLAGSWTALDKTPAPNGCFDDIVTIELRHLIKLCLQCNMTALEILWSNLITFKRPEFEVVLKRRSSFLDNDRLYHAAKGYADSQNTHVEKIIGARQGKRMMRDDARRAGKFAAAYLRNAHQAAVLLRTGTYQPDDLGPNDAYIRRLKKSGIVDALDLAEFRNAKALAERKLDEAYRWSPARTPDTEGFIDLTRDIYFSVETDRAAYASETDRAAYAERLE